MREGLLGLPSSRLHCRQSAARLLLGLFLGLLLCAGVQQPARGLQLVQLQVACQAPLAPARGHCPGQLTPAQKQEVRSDAVVSLRCGQHAPEGSDCGVF